MAVPSFSFAHLVQTHQAIILFVENELLSQENFHKLADHVAHQARFENRLVFPILCQPCAWENSSLKHIPMYPLNKRPISEWESPDAGWQQVLQEINTVLNPYRAFYEETPLEKALRGVCRVQLDAKTAISGFLIGPNLLLTSSLLTPEKAEHATVHFTRSGGLTAMFRLIPDHFLLTDLKAGITLVTVETECERHQFREAPTIDTFQTLTLSNTPTQPNERLFSATFDSVLQLPSAYQMVEFADEDHIRYRGPLVPGALGGPLLTENLEVAAVSPEGGDYELFAYSKQSQQFEQHSSTVPTIQALLREMVSRTTAKDWQDATGADVRPPLLREFPFRERSSLYEVPTNRTLFVQCFTDGPPLIPEVIERLQSLEDIFDHFKPEVMIDFTGLNGQAITETFRFRALSDFDLDQITKQSPFLRDLAQQQTLADNPNIRQISENRLRQNQLIVIERIRELETAYRSTDLFFQNAQTNRIKNLSVINAPIDQISDQDNPRFYNEIAQELTDSFDRLDLKHSYSLLVIPGFLRSRGVLDQWAQLAYVNKVMLLTDYRHLDDAEDVLHLWARDSLVGFDGFKSNVVMACNYLFGRDAYSEIGEEESLYLPPSLALAGKLYAQKLEKSGDDRLLSNTKTWFDLTKTNLGDLENQGLVILTNAFNELRTTSRRTLYNGDNAALRFYPIVRFVDWLVKSLRNFMNRRAFENWTYHMAQEQRREIDEFLASLIGPGKIISAYRILRYEPDPNTKRGRYLVLQLTFPALTQTFEVHLIGEEDPEGGIKWNEKID